MSAAVFVSFVALTFGPRERKSKGASAQPWSPPLVNDKKQFCLQFEISANSSLPEACLFQEIGKYV